MRYYRSAFIDLIREHCPNPRAGAEVGVHAGILSGYLLGAFPDLRLYMVDPYRAWPPGSRYYEEHGELGRLTDAEWHKVMDQAIRNVRREGRGRYSMAIMTSDQAVKYHTDGSLDFVLLDADHTYEGVTEDIQLWKSKVRPGGLLCGHDYGGPTETGVAQAVCEAFGRENIITRRRARIWGYIIPQAQGEPNGNSDDHPCSHGLNPVAGQAPTSAPPR